MEFNSFSKMHADDTGKATTNPFATKDTCPNTLNFAAKVQALKTASKDYKDLPSVQFTGFSSSEKSRLIKIAEAMGFRVVNRGVVPQHLSLLVTGDAPGSNKIRDAQTCGAMIVDRDKFLEIARIAEVDPTHSSEDAPKNENDFFGRPKRRVTKDDVTMAVTGTPGGGISKANLYRLADQAGMLVYGYGSTTPKSLKILVVGDEPGATTLAKAKQNGAMIMTPAEFIAHANDIIVGEKAPAKNNAQLTVKHNSEPDPDKNPIAWTASTRIAIQAPSPSSDTGRNDSVPHLSMIKSPKDRPVGIEDHLLGGIICGFLIGIPAAYIVGPLVGAAVLLFFTLIGLQMRRSNFKDTITKVRAFAGKMEAAVIPNIGPFPEDPEHLAKLASLVADNHLRALIALRPSFNETSDTDLDGLVSLLSNCTSAEKIVGNIPDTAQKISALAARAGAPEAEYVLFGVYGNDNPIVNKVRAAAASQPTLSP